MKTELVKPTKKGKRDGEVDALSSDDGYFLVMRGDYNQSEIIEAAIKQNVIDAEEAIGWASAEYYQCWYKTTPDGSGEHSSVNYSRNTPCRGAFFSSSLVWH